LPGGCYLPNIVKELTDITPKTPKAMKKITILEIVFKVYFFLTNKNAFTTIAVV
jgi:hypothetical protein